MGWTKEQQRVIDLRGKNILVSAAAGSGKTAVLVERILGKLVKDRVDIDRLVVVTFTRAAAAEMKERIGLRLEKELVLHPDDEHLQRQMRLLPHSQITTIDSFCSYIIRNYFHTIDMDPGFTMGDESDMQMMKQDVLQELLEEEYAQKRPEFLAFVETMVTGRRDEVLMDEILDLYHFSCSNPWPTKWLLSCLSRYANEEGELPMWTEEALHQGQKILKDIAVYQKRAEQLCNLPDGPSQYLEAIMCDSELVKRLQTAESLDDWYNCLQAVSYQALSRKKNADENPDIKERVKMLRKSFKDGISILTRLFAIAPLQEELEKTKELRPIGEEWVNLTIQFAERFAKAKEEKNILDFNDLEHKALEILVEEREEDGEWKLCPTMVADELAHYYDEILIDEYQDSNLVQETILTSISAERFGRYNRFMVGDVKQSIYRFRLARPELFLEKYRKYRTAEEEPDNCERIDLHKNFRSRAVVLDSVNAFFYQMMHESLGGVEYDKQAALYEGNVFEETDQKIATEAELLLTDIDFEDEDENTESTIELEARSIAKRIHEMCDSEDALYLWDDRSSKTGTYRKARYGDVVILLRTNKGKAEVMARVLQEEGIPALLETSTGYFQTYEIRSICNLLRVLDNPRQDIPLAAVIRNRWGQMSDDDLAELAIRHPKEELFDRLQKEALCAQEGESESLAVRCLQFLNWLNGLRKEVPFHSVYDLLQLLYREKDFYTSIMVMPGGEQRVANLDLLCGRARKFEQASHHGLGRFIQYVEKIERYEMDFGEASIAGQTGQQSVTIMSIHKSKGLEFPIVIAAGMAGRFNLMDARGSVVMHPDMGVGMDLLNPKLRTKKSMLLKRVMQERLLQDNLGEEMRVLYVALTRAKEKLIISGAVNKLTDKCAKWESQSMDYTTLRRATCFLDWLMPAWFQQSDAPIRFIACSAAGNIREAVYEKMNQITRRQELLASVDTVETGKWVDEIEWRRNYQYPYEGEQGLPAKLAVSDLKKKAVEEEEEIHSIWASTESEPIPVFRSVEHSFNGADRGTIYHKVMEKLPFSGEISKAVLEEQLQVFVQEGVLREEERELIGVEQLLTFCRSNLGQRMRRSMEQGVLKRETPFVMGIPAKELPNGCDSEELVLVQGIIDAFFEEDGEYVLVDYKTDSLNPKDSQAAQVLAHRYREQMHYYRLALERVYGCRVKEIILYSFALGCEVLVD